MNKYVCTICGYVYDESVGLPEENIGPGTSWQDLPEDWACPLCGASKDLFDQEEQEVAVTLESEQINEPAPTLDGLLSDGALSALFSNLSKGCEKQFRKDEQNLFDQLSTYYSKRQAKLEMDDGSKYLEEAIHSSLNQAYKEVQKTAQSIGDRGAQRALVWSEKVTRMQASVIGRYNKEGVALLEDTKAFVCEICGFIYIGDEAPEVCPVCKVPKMKIIEVKRG